MHRPKKNSVKKSYHIRKSVKKCPLAFKGGNIMLKTAIPL